MNEICFRSLTDGFAGGRLMIGFSSRWTIITNAQFGVIALIRLTGNYTTSGLRNPLSCFTGWITGFSRRVTCRARSFTFYTLLDKNPVRFPCSSNYLTLKNRWRTCAICFATLYFT